MLPLRSKFIYMDNFLTLLYKHFFEAEKRYQDFINVQVTTLEYADVLQREREMSLAEVERLIEIITAYTKTIKK